MGFKPVVDYYSGKSSNSKVSENFKSMYDHIVYEKYKENEEHMPSKTFAPSSFRCDRLSFFRIRGVEPDSVSSIDTSLNFTAILGTAMHREIQTNLKNSIGHQWVDAVDYLSSHELSHEYRINNHGDLETQIEFLDPPVKFSCDGLLNIGDKVYLLEIKSSESSSFKKLSEPKIQHIDQITCYCALMELRHALVLYQDRMYGETKCFEMTISDSQAQHVFERMDRVIDFVNKNIAPPRLPKGDFWCTYCKYKKRCSQWG